MTAIKNRFWFLAAIYIYVLPLFFMTATPDRIIPAILEISVALFLLRWFRKEIKKENSKVCEKCQARKENSHLSFPSTIMSSMLTDVPIPDILEMLNKSEVMEMVNRITRAIVNAEKKISDLNGVGLNGKPLNDIDVSLSFEEFGAFQNAQSKAFASGLLSMDEAQLIYNSLGGEMHHGDDGWPSGTSQATKLVIIQVCAELMGVGV